MGLTIGLTYNLKNEFPATINSPVDSNAECESQQTVDAIIAGLEANGHRIVPLPYNHNLPHRLQTSRLDLVFNIAEGWTGRNRESLIPAMLEFFDLPYTGSDPLTLGIALDKSLCKTILSAMGIPSARWVVLDHPNQCENVSLSYPLFVKPNEEGSSKGIRSQSRVESCEDLSRQVAWIVDNYRQPALVEEFLPGREFSIGIIGNLNPKVLPIIEVLPGTSLSSCGDFVYSFEVKSDNLETLVCPAQLEPMLENQLRRMALQAFSALHCRDFARVDFRLNAEGLPHFLEINPLPGLSKVSLFSLQAKAAGMELPALLQAVVNAALERYPYLAGQTDPKEVVLG